ncbi:hypothetical protein GQ43DRAFT_436617 [Delitschia confertaspora ATCC 74209]|uniref:Uncharacterized protein n=1 Tax=Delitschia confertaspora ATCC 74209 TaxID=1513339 RepID=A0A9P4MWK8_9PLEO|nr:hypothetical protein GQ43DRAFT_436617 [Delitschia confertaspora ATCC 74209]
MDSSIFLRQLLRSPSSYLVFLSSPARAQLPTTLRTALRTTYPTRYISTDSLPRVLQPSLWNQIIPKFLRRNPSGLTGATPKRKGWNPATPYIILSLLVGSQAIQTLWLKREMAHFNRRADAKIGVLKEVVERVQRGEDVDVERVLGTGSGVEEGEWEEVMKEIAEEEQLFQSRQRRRALKDAQQAEIEQGQKERIIAQRAAGVEKDLPEPVVKVVTHKGARFY